MKYTFDENGISNGSISDERAYDERRTDWTDVPPPAVARGERARWVDGAWAIEVDPLPYQRAGERVNRERARRLEALVVRVGGMPFDADTSSRANLQGLLTAAAAGVPLPWPITWRRADDLVAMLDQPTAAAVAAAMLAGVSAIYARSWYLKDVVLANLSPTEVAACDVTSDDLWNTP